MAHHSPTLTTRTSYVLSPNGITYAYRFLKLPSTPEDALPILLPMHFRGNMDLWDPAFVDPLVDERPVLIFDQAGVGRSGGTVATKIQEWAEHAFALLDALQIDRIDLLGFSMGGLVAQQMALTRPNLVRRMVLAATLASGAPLDAAEKGDTKGIVWPQEVPPSDISTILNGAEPDSVEAVAHVNRVCYYLHTEQGSLASTGYMDRIQRRHVVHEPNMIGFLSREATNRQLDAQYDWMTYNPKYSWDRLGELKMPVLVAVGDEDYLIPSSRAWELTTKIPGASLMVYPNSGHGFIWQYTAQFSHDVNHFLSKD